MGRVGFKTNAVREAESKEENQNVEATEEMVNVTPLQAETIHRIEHINQVICSPEFSKMAVEQKQGILNELRYITQVSTYIL